MKNIAMGVLLLLTAGCASMTNSAAPINPVCPVSAEPVNADSPSVMVDDTKVGFCCENCVNKFNESTLAEQREAVQKILADM